MLTYLSICKLFFRNARLLCKWYLESWVAINKNFKVTMLWLVFRIHPSPREIAIGHFSTTSFEIIWIRCVSQSSLDIEESCYIKKSYFQVKIISNLITRGSIHALADFWDCLTILLWNEKIFFCPSSPSFILPALLRLSFLWDWESGRTVQESDKLIKLVL